MELLSNVGTVVRDRLGLHYPSQRVRELEAVLHDVADRLGCDGAEACARKIAGEPLDADELKTLAQALTVGETNFYRDRSVFQALERDVLPTLIEERRRSRRIRIWSAGCCTGEEPYTIAMILRRILTDIDDWNVTILATDVNPTFLAKAECGLYGKWSFRRTPQWMWRDYFSPQRGGHFEIEPRVRSMVTFEHLNLAEDAYPSLFNNTNAMDIVFCRNVLIYFDQPTIERVVGGLRSSLLAGGWLALGRSERAPASVDSLSPVTVGTDVWYRRDPELPVEPVAAPIEAATRRRSDGDPVEAAQALFDRGDYAAAVRKLSRYLDNDTPSRTERRRTLRLVAEACANLGRLEEAQRWCGDAIAMDQLDPRLHYLLASVLLERKCTVEAAESLANAISADDRFVMAHFGLGNLKRRNKESTGARGHYQRVLALLRHYPDDEIIPESDGMTAGRLSQITEQALLQCWDR